jgi:hypothetical protein
MRHAAVREWSAIMWVIGGWRATSERESEVLAATGRDLAGDAFGVARPLNLPVTVVWTSIGHPTW